MGTESAEEEDAPDGRLEPGVRWAMLLPYHCFLTFGHVADTIMLACVPVLGFGFSEGSLGMGREESLCQETSCGTLGLWLQPLVLWLIPTARWSWGFILSGSRWRYQMWAQSSPSTLCWCHLYYHSLLTKPLIQVAVRSPGRNWVWVYLWGSQRKDCQYKVVETISLVYRELGDKGKVLCHFLAMCPWVICLTFLSLLHIVLMRIQYKTECHVGDSGILNLIGSQE